MIGFIIRAALVSFLGIADLVMTLLHYFNHRLDETNPIAQVVLQNGGPLGLTCFKTMATFAIIGPAAIIYGKNHPRAALWILNGAMAMGLLVAAYHIYLITLL